MSSSEVRGDIGVSYVVLYAPACQRVFHQLSTPGGLSFPGHGLLWCLSVCSEHPVKRAGRNSMDHEQLVMASRRKSDATWRVPYLLPKEAALPDTHLAAGKSHDLGHITFWGWADLVQAALKDGPLQEDQTLLKIHSNPVADPTLLCVCCSVVCQWSLILLSFEHRCQWCRNWMMFCVCRRQI